MTFQEVKAMFPAGKVKAMFPAGTLLTHDCWSILILSWRSDGKRATVLFEDGEIQSRREQTIKIYAAQRNVTILLP